jgi:prophage DNA circulation protein
MAWREQLGSASFRGVEFKVEMAALAGGRKTVAHEYPLRDVPFVEDLGRRARTFSIDGYVIGSDYLTQKERLLAALEELGPGPLVHPYYGRRLVACTEYSMRESRDEGGMARFSLQFVETEATPFSPSVAKAPLSTVRASADAAAAAANADFLSSYSLTLPASGAPALVSTSAKPLPGFTFTSVAGVVTGFSTSLRSTLSPVIRGTQELASLKRATNALAFDATALVRDPVSLVTRLGELFSDLVEWPRTPRLGVQALLAAYRFTSAASRPPATTATRARELANYDAADAFIRRRVVLEAARAAASAAESTVDSGEGFETYEDAIAVRDAILEQLDEQADTASDTAYPPLVQVRADVVGAVPGAQHELPRLVTHVLGVTTPSLVLAYRLYGDVALVEDVVLRNRVRHPGFVVGGRSLQVLSNA